MGHAPDDRPICMVGLAVFAAKDEPDDLVWSEMAVNDQTDSATAHIHQRTLDGRPATQSIDQSLARTRTSLELARILFGHHDLLAARE
jgi:hypothetical protein